MSCISRPYGLCFLLLPHLNQILVRACRISRPYGLCFLLLQFQNRKDDKANSNFKTLRVMLFVVTSLPRTVQCTTGIFQDPTGYAFCCYSSPSTWGSSRPSTISRPYGLCFLLLPASILAPTHRGPAAFQDPTGYAFCCYFWTYGYRVAGGWISRPYGLCFLLLPEWDVTCLVAWVLRFQDPTGYAFCCYRSIHEVKAS